MTEIHIQKSSGLMQPIDYEKINKVVEWACEGLTGVHVSEVVMKSRIKFFDGITTSDIHESLVKSAAELIDDGATNYQYVAANLLLFKLRKEAFGKYTPPALYDHTVKNIKAGRYASHLVEDYSKKEFAELDKHLDHNKDLKYTYASMRQWQRKYLVQDRVTKKVRESPQQAIMLIAMALFSQTQENRLEKVKEFYDAVSNMKLSLPTPIMAGVRTPTKQFSSCTVIDCGDSLDSITESTRAIVNYVSQRAGIGLNVGRIRAEGESIRKGEAVHTGLIPFIKMFQAAVHSCSQGGVRKGSATLNYPVWHLEFENLIVLKNNRGVEENRARHLDYAVHVSRLFIERLIKGGDITFFSPNVADGQLYELFYKDQAKFKRLYEKLEKDDNIRKKTVPALEVFSSIMNERGSTSRIYMVNADHLNDYGVYKTEAAQITMTNLCAEIALETTPLDRDGNGQIALCTLAAFNLGNVKYDEYDRLAELIVEALDNLLDYQDYPMPEAEKQAMNQRTLGIGVINYAYWLAKRGLKYSDGSANDATHILFEKISHSLLKASNKLAKERGAAPEFAEKSKYADGIMPVDKYKKDVDEHVGVELKCDWDSLREDVVKHGLRNMALMALMPSETSSIISNATNGIEPARAYVIVKDSSDGIIRQVLPDLDNLKDSYETAWSIPNNTGYLTLSGIMQKFVDQAISVNTYYTPKNFPNNRIPLELMLADMVHWYKMGNKTMYYQNTNDGNDQDIELIGDSDESCAGGACAI